MRQKSIQVQAERLIREHGDQAYMKAKEAERTARQRRNARLEKYLVQVTQEVIRRTRTQSSQLNSKVVQAL